MTRIHVVVPETALRAVNEFVRNASSAALKLASQRQMSPVELIGRYQLAAKPMALAAAALNALLEPSSRLDLERQSGMDILTLFARQASPFGAGKDSAEPVVLAGELVNCRRI